MNLSDFIFKKKSKEGLGVYEFYNVNAYYEVEHKLKRVELLKSDDNFHFIRMDLNGSDLQIILLVGINFRR